MSDLFSLPAFDAPPVDCEPNAHGCYPTDAAEHIFLPRRRKGWLGCNMADIYLLHLPEGWIMSVGYMLAESGGGGPLTLHWMFMTRSEALDAAIAELSRRVSDRDWKSTTERNEREQVRVWLATLL